MDFHGGQSIHRQTQLFRRPVRAEHRDELGKQLQRTLPRSMYLEQIHTNDEKTMEMGNGDSAPTKDVLTNISCETRRKARLHKEEILSLQEKLDSQTNTPEEVLQ